MDFFLIVLAIIAVVGALIWGFHAAAKRRKELQEFAGSNGLTFDESRDYGLESIYQGFRCLHQGNDRYGYNHLTGQWKSYDLHGFDYHYETYSHDSKGNRQTHHHNFSAVVLKSKMQLQDLFIRPEGFFDKVTEFFGADDIDFESTEFSKKFYVKALDKKWAFDVIHQRTMQFLLDSPRFSIQFDQNHIIAYQSGTFAPQEFGQAADVICGIMERMPDYLVQQQMGKS